MYGNYSVPIVIKAYNQYSTEFNTLNKKLDQVSSKISRVTHLTTTWGNKLGQLGRSLSLRLTAPLMGFAGYALKQAANFEDINKRLLVASGSAKDAAKAMALVKKLTMESRFSPEEVADSTQKLLALGYSMQQVTDKMGVLTKVSEGSKLGLEGVTNIYTRMLIMSKKHKGAIEPRSLVMLAKSGIPVVKVMQEMAAKAGMNKKKFDELFASGRLGFGLVEEALKRISKQKAFETIGDSMARLHNISRVFVNDLAEAVLNAFGIKDNTKKAADSLQQMEEKFSKFLQAHPILVKISAILFGIAIILAPILVCLAAIAGLFALISLPVLGIAIAVAAIAVGAHLLGNKLGTLLAKSNTFKAIIQSIHDFFQKMMHPIDYITNKLSNLHLPGFGGAIQTPTAIPAAGSILGTHTINNRVAVDINVADPHRVVQNVKTNGTASTTKYDLGRNNRLER